MRRLLRLIALVPLLVSAPAHAQSTAALPVDRVLALVRERHVLRDSTDWTAVERGVRAAVGRARSRADSIDALLQLFVSLDDVHSALIVSGRSYSHYHAMDGARGDSLRQLMGRAQSVASPQYTQMLSNVAYVRLHHVAPTGADAAPVAAAIRSALCTLVAQRPRGVILDLRLNTGGNMYPMLGGLGPLLGDGPIGGEVDATGRMVRSWTIVGGNFEQAGAARTGLRQDCPAAATLPVVVLIGPLTISSGEAVAAAFRGRPRTALLGESPEPGYSTANGWFPIDADVTLNLSTEFLVDRRGVVVRRTVAPDQVVRGWDFDQLDRDPVVLAAIAWLGRNR
ncbi:MAG: hypothetical protein IPP90_03145 [Gemmatimonadaceae bacterium]|nr:hypothetical protein [Gemmatimonadaceae bacterium]